MAVGGDQAHFIRPQHEQRTVEKIPGVFPGDGELRLRHHLPERRARQRRADGTAGFRQRRKIFAGERLHARVEPIGGHFHATLICGDPDVGLRQRLDDLVELLGRQCQRPAFLDQRGALTPKTHFKVGSQKADVVALGFHQHIGQDGNRVLSLDNALKELQFPQEVILPDDKFHGCADLEMGGALARNPQGEERFKNVKL